MSCRKVKFSNMLHHLSFWNFMYLLFVNQKIVISVADTEVTQKDKGKLDSYKIPIENGEKIYCNGTIQSKFGWWQSVLESKHCTLDIKNVQDTCYAHFQIEKLKYNLQNHKCSENNLTIFDQNHRLVFQLCELHASIEVVLKLKNISKLHLEFITESNKERNWKIRYKLQHCNYVKNEVGQNFSRELVQKTKGIFNREKNKVAIMVEEPNKYCKINLEECNNNTPVSKKSLSSEICPTQCNLRCIMDSIPLCDKNCRLSCSKGCNKMHHLTNPFHLISCCKCICKFSKSKENILRFPNWIKHFTKDIELKKNCRCICPKLIGSYSLYHEEFCNECVCPLEVSYPSKENTINNTFCPQQCHPVEKKICKLKNLADILSFKSCGHNCRYRCSRGFSPGCGKNCELFCWENCQFNSRDADWKRYQRCCRCLCYKNTQGPWFSAVNHTQIISTDRLYFLKNCGCECDVNIHNKCLKDPWCYTCLCPLQKGGVGKYEEENGKNCSLCRESCFLAKKHSCEITGNDMTFCGPDCQLRCRKDFSPGCRANCYLTCLPGCLSNRIDEGKKSKENCCSCVCQSSNGNKWIEKVDWSDLVAYNTDHFKNYCECDCELSYCNTSGVEKHNCVRCICPLQNKLKMHSFPRSFNKTQCQVSSSKNCGNSNRIKKKLCPYNCELLCKPDEDLRCPRSCSLKCMSPCTKNLRKCCKCTCPHIINSMAINEQNVNLLERCECKCKPVLMVCQRNFPKCYSCSCPVKTNLHHRMFSHNSLMTQQDLFCSRCLPFCQLKYNEECKPKTKKRIHLCNKDCTYKCKVDRSPGCPLNCRLECDKYKSPLVDISSGKEFQKNCKCICHSNENPFFWLEKVSLKHYLEGSGDCFCDCNNHKCLNSNGELINNHCSCKTNNFRKIIDDLIDRCEDCPNDCKNVEIENRQEKSNRFCHKECSFYCEKTSLIGCSSNCNLECLPGCPFNGKQSKMNSIKNCCRCICYQYGKFWSHLPNFSKLLSANQDFLDKTCRCRCPFSDNHQKIEDYDRCYINECKIQKNVNDLQFELSNQSIPSRCRIKMLNICPTKNLFKHEICDKNCRFKCNDGGKVGCPENCSIICLPGCKIEDVLLNYKEKVDCCKCKCKGNFENVNWKKLKRIPQNDLLQDCHCLCRPIMTESLHDILFIESIKCLCPLNHERNMLIPINKNDIHHEISKMYKELCPKNCKVMTGNLERKNKTITKCPKSCTFKCYQEDYRFGCPKSCKFYCEPGCPFTGSLDDIANIRSCCKCQCDNRTTSIDWSVLTANIDSISWDSKCSCECLADTNICFDEELAKICYKCLCPTMIHLKTDKARVTVDCPSCQSKLCDTKLDSSCAQYIEKKYENLCRGNCELECKKGQISACPLQCQLACLNKGKGKKCKCICKGETQPVKWIKLLSEKNPMRHCSCICQINQTFQMNNDMNCHYCKCSIKEEKLNGSKINNISSKSQYCPNDCELVRNNTCGNIQEKPKKALCNKHCSFNCLKGRSPGCGLNCSFICNSKCNFYGNAATENEINECCYCKCENKQDIYLEEVNFAAIISTYSFSEYCYCNCKSNSWSCSDKSIREECYNCKCPLINGSLGLYDRNSEHHSCIKCHNKKCLLQIDNTCKNEIQPRLFCRKNCQFKCRHGHSPGCDINCHLTCDENCPFLGHKTNQTHANQCCRCLCNKENKIYVSDVNWAAIRSTVSYQKFCFCECLPEIDNCPAYIDNECYQCVCPLYNSTNSVRRQRWKSCLSCPQNDCKILKHTECIHQNGYHTSVSRHFNSCNQTIEEQCSKWIETNPAEIANDFNQDYCKEDCSLRCNQKGSEQMCEKNCRLVCIPNCPIFGYTMNFNEIRQCCSCSCNGINKEVKQIISSWKPINYTENCECVCLPSLKDCMAQNVRINCHECVCSFQNKTKTIKENTCLTCENNCDLKLKTECGNYKYEEEKQKESRSNDGIFSSENVFLYEFEIEDFDNAFINSAENDEVHKVIDTQGIADDGKTEIQKLCSELCSLSQQDSYNDEPNWT